jgi:hydroxymethylbilane synthase
MIVIGSRGSALALAQTDWIRNQILSRFPGSDITVKIIKTSADKDQTTSLRSGSGIGVFVKELEQALLKKQIDIAVHSLKDVPTTVSAGLKIAAVPEREDARDAIITKNGGGLAQLPEGSLIGTGSIRRQAQILALRPDLRVIDIRGNIDTRLKKLRDGAYDAIILACAGLNRLGFQDQISERLDFSAMLPAPGQGALAIEIRDGDSLIEPIVAALNEQSALTAVSAEREFLKRMGGGCNVPVAAHAYVRQDAIHIEGLVCSPDGRNLLRDSLDEELARAAEAGRILAEKILGAGGDLILQRSAPRP